jgi:hypothetical protein
MSDAPLYDDIHASELVRSQRERQLELANAALKAKLGYATQLHLERDRALAEGTRNPQRHLRSV